MKWKTLLAGLLVVAAIFTVASTSSAAPPVMADATVTAGTCSPITTPITVDWTSGPPTTPWVAAAADPAHLFDGADPSGVGDVWVYHFGDATPETIMIDFGQAVDLDRIAFNNGENSAGQIYFKPDVGNEVSVAAIWANAPYGTWAQFDFDATTQRVEFRSDAAVKINELLFCGPSASPTFSCSVDAGVVSWTDAAQAKYWIYRSTDGGASFVWLGRSEGGVEFVDAAPVVGAKYQVHYEGIPRVGCVVIAEPPSGGPFSCSVDAGVVSWTDAAQAKYWIYRSTDGGASFVWLGRSLGGTQLTDAAPVVGAKYQVHYQGIPRVECANAVGPACAIPEDAYCDTEHIIDSFGDETAAGIGHQWMAISNPQETGYYDIYFDDVNANYDPADPTTFLHKPRNWRSEGMCPLEWHNSFWVGERQADGSVVKYPTWHPSEGRWDLDGDGTLDRCFAMHEHGSRAPFESPLYDEAAPGVIGVPFGYVHSQLMPFGGERLEDHVGHKVVVANGIELIDGNPYNAGALFNRLGITCNWLSKLHQGSHSPDALANNMHEYFLNLSCDDGTHVRLKEMTDFGYPGFPSVDGQVVNGCTSTWFPTGFQAAQADPDRSVHSDTGDAKREFHCLLDNGKPEEIWKPSTQVDLPRDAGGSDTGWVNYAPYYIVVNPSRYAIDQWETKLQDGGLVGDNAMVSTVDLCVGGSEFNDEATIPTNRPDGGGWWFGDFCDEVPASTMADWTAAITAGDNYDEMIRRKESPDNPFNGTRRGVHTKGVNVGATGGIDWATGERWTNYNGLRYFCTDAYGESAAWPVEANNPAVEFTLSASPPSGTPVCADGILQSASATTNDHWGTGSDGGDATGLATAGNQVIGGGVASEIVIDMTDAEMVRSPN